VAVAAATAAAPSYILLNKTPRERLAGERESGERKALAGRYL